MAVYYAGVDIGAAVQTIGVAADFAGVFAAADIGPGDFCRRLVSTLCGSDGFGPVFYHPCGDFARPPLDRGRALSFVAASGLYRSADCVGRRRIGDGRWFGIVRFIAAGRLGAGAADRDRRTLVGAAIRRRLPGVPQ